jgi:3-phosphoshikimate 1-carboxyvinyltransferase
MTVPGDKSISHRALILGGVAHGKTTVRGFLEGDDCLATLNALQALGVRIARDAGGVVNIDGRGFEGLRASAQALDLGNSGTAMRLMAGLLAASPFDVELTGDASLRSRPMQRIVEPLTAMGAKLTSQGGRAPLRIGAGAHLHGIDYILPIASAQVKSAVLLAGLSATGRTSVRSPGPSRDHTERMLLAMGAALTQDGDIVAIEGPARLRACDIEVPGDFSSAAFFIVAACLGADDGLLIENVGLNPTRTGLLRMLESMGADIELRNQRRLGAEDVADLFVRKAPLQGVEVPADLVPLSIDEFPAFFVAAAGASGRTVVRGAEELRHKESDRIAAMARALSALGARVEELPDGLAIEGGRLHAATIDAVGDHRVAMACSVASLISDGAIEILHTAEVATSFPGFSETARECGLALRVES